VSPSLKRPSTRDPRNATRGIIALSILGLLALVIGQLFWVMRWPTGDWRNGPLVQLWLPIFMSACFLSSLVYGLVRLYRERRDTPDSD
jgi:hypothetical protein